MRRNTWFVPFVMLAFVASGCRNSEAEAARLRAEAEATRLHAEAEMSRARVEMEAARTENAILRMQLEQLRTELKARNIPVPELPKVETPATVSTKSIEQRFYDLQNLYNKNAINLQEWSDMKRKLIDEVPNTVAVSERRTLGKRLIDLKGIYDKSAAQLQEWTDLKRKLIQQMPTGSIVLETELLDLKTAYDQSAINLQEWTDAKAMVGKRTK